MSKVDLQEFKDTVPAVQAVIKKIHKVDTGKQNALDVIAVCRGFTDYHRVKVVAGMKFYELQANIGTEEKPCIIKQDIGPCGNAESAAFAARNILLNSHVLITWKILEDGQETNYIIKTYMNGEMDILTPKAIEMMAKADEDTPEESFSINDVDCVQEYKAKHIAFDSKDIIDRDNDFSELRKRFNQRETEYESWENYLILAEQIRLEDIESYANDEDAVFHAISEDSKPRFHGDAEYVIGSLAKMSGSVHTYYLFIEIDRD